MDLLRLASQTFARARERVGRWLKSPHRAQAGTIALFAFILLCFALYPHTALADTGWVDTIMLGIAKMLLTVATWLGDVAGLLIDVLVNVIVYNHFATSQVVSSGWAIVRDAVNMFYVILLIVIAFGTIIGLEKFKWSEQIPRLLKWAIIINFSKTLCGLAIDASQVFTLTFANALKDIAAGNLIAAFGLNKIFTFAQNTDPTSAAAATGTGYGPGNYLGASLGACLMMVIVLGVLAALLVIMVYRIVMLWILIVISPLTWFVGSAKGIIDGHAYSQWWTDFKCYLVIGPVLTFFLWLALSVAGAGNLAGAEGFTPAPYGAGATSIFEPGAMASFIIALAIIFAGFQTANEFCAAASGGFVKKALGKAQGFAKSTALAPLRFGAGAAKGVGSRIPLVGAKGVGLGLGIPNRNQAMTKLTRGAQSGLRNIPIVGAAAAGLLNKPAEHFEHEQHATEEAMAKRREGATKSFASEDQEMAFMKDVNERAKSGKRLLTVGSREAATGLLQKAIKDKDYRKKLEDQGFDVGAMMQASGKDMDEIGHHDEKFKESYKNFKDENAHYFTKKGENGKYDFSDQVKDPDKLRKMNFDAINPEKLKQRTGESETDFDARKVDAAQRMDDLAEQMRAAPSGEVDKDGKPLNQYEAARLGKLGGKAAIAMNGLAAKQPITSLIQPDGSFASDLDEKDFIEKTRRNPESIASISSQLAANGGKNDAATALAGSQTEKNLQGLVRKFRDPSTDDATKQQLGASMESLLSVLTTAKNDPLNDEKEQKKYERMHTYVSETGLNRPVAAANATTTTVDATVAAAPAQPAPPAPSGIDTTAVQATLESLRTRIGQMQAVVNNPINRPFERENQANLDDLNRQMSELSGLMQQQARAQQTLQRAEEAETQGTGNAQAVQAVRDRIAALEADIRRRTPPST